MKRFAKQLLGAGVACSLCLLTLPSVEFAGVSFIGTQAAAQEEQPPIKLPGCKKEPAKRKLKTVGQKFIKKMGPIDEMIQPAEDEKTGKAPPPRYKEAWSELKKIMNRCDDCSKAEYALVYQRAAIVQYNLDDIPEAIKYFKKVIDQAPDIHISQETGLTYQIAQLYSAEENYPEAIKWFDKWESLCPTTVSDSYFYLRGQTMYLMDRKDEALRLVNKSIDLRKAKGEMGEESWYRLLMAIYIDKEDYKSAEKIAEVLAVNFPSDRVLMQLAQIYGMNGKPTRQRALLDALNVANKFDKESSFKNLSYLFLDAEAPYLAARTMEKGIKKEVVKRDTRNLESWGMSLFQAQETDAALPIIEEAAKKSGDGKLYTRLAAIYYDAEKYDESIKAGKAALKKGDIKSPAEVNLYLGLSYLSKQQYDSAIAAFKKAVREEKFEKTASDLMKYAKREKDREEKLRKAKLNT